MPYLSEDKECIGFMLKSEPGMGFVSTVSARTLLTGSHKQKVKIKIVQKYRDAIPASARPCSCRRGFVSTSFVVGEGQPPAAPECRG